MKVIGIVVDTREWGRRGIDGSRDLVMEYGRLREKAYFFCWNFLEMKWVVRRKKWLGVGVGWG